MTIKPMTKEEAERFLADNPKPWDSDQGCGDMHIVDANGKVIDADYLRSYVDYIEREINLLLHILKWG